MDKKTSLNSDDKQSAELKKEITEKIIVERSSRRVSTEAIITCCPYSSSGAYDAIDGVMGNFSNQGSYVETSHAFKPGTILIVRVVCYLNLASSMPHEHRPRSICLAEVKWQQKLNDEKAIKYGMGLRHLD